MGLMRHWILREVRGYICCNTYLVSSYRRPVAWCTAPWWTLRCGTPDPVSPLCTVWPASSWRLAIVMVGRAKERKERLATSIGFDLRCPRQKQTDRNRPAGSAMLAFAYAWVQLPSSVPCTSTAAAVTSKRACLLSWWCRWRMKLYRWYRVALWNPLSWLIWLLDVIQLP